MATKIITKTVNDIEIEMTVRTDDENEVEIEADETDGSMDLIHNDFRRRLIYRKAGVYDSPVDDIF